jgi:hypothetical protein
MSKFKYVINYVQWMISEYNKVSRSSLTIYWAQLTTIFNVINHMRLLLDLYRVFQPMPTTM